MLEIKKPFLLGLTRRRIGVDSRYGAGKRSDDFEGMLTAARNAGFDVIEDATYDTIKSMWESREYDTIVYYNHGKGTQLQYDFRSGSGFKPMSVIFNVRNGYAKNLTIVCCQYHKVVIPNIFDYYKANVNLAAVPVGQLPNGDVDRTVAQRTLTNYFSK